MKHLLSAILWVLISAAAFSQGQDVQVFEKKEGNKVIVVARNVGKVSYEITIDVNATGMTVTPGMTVKAVVPAGYMKEMVTLEPIPGQGWSYGYEISFVESLAAASPGTLSTTERVPAREPATTPAETPALSDAALIIYTQHGCSRCAFITKELTARGIAYEEVDVNGTSPEINHMWMKLREGGFSGNSVTMPVIRHNGQYLYNIKDLKGFVETVK